MTRDDQQRLDDIIECARDLTQITRFGIDEFLKNKISQRAAERLLEIIGEAANAIDPNVRANHDAVAWRHIISLRHRLAHHYHRIDPQQVCQIATVYVPELAELLQEPER